MQSMARMQSRLARKLDLSHALEQTATLNR